MCRMDDSDHPARRNHDRRYLPTGAIRHPFGRNNRIPGTPVVVQTQFDNAIHVAVEPSIWSIPFCRSAGLTLFIFVGLCIVAMSGETIKCSFLPLYMEENLNAPAWIRGAVISTHPFLELMLISFGGWLSERFGAHRLILIGIACGIIAQLLFATGSSIPIFFLGQVFSSTLIGTVLSLGMTVAMDIHANGPGFATSVFLGGLGLSSTVGGLVGSIGVARPRLPHVFFLPAITGGIALIGMTVLFMKTTLLRHQGST